jgi:porphobilinogen synthase
VSTFPVTRLRRFRRTSTLRSLVRETRLDLEDFVFPVFVAPEPLPNDALPALSRLTVEELVAEAEQCVSLGVSALLLFGLPEEKDDRGSGAWDDEGIVQQALRAVRARVPSSF